MDVSDWIVLDCIQLDGIRFYETVWDYILLDKIGMDSIALDCIMIGLRKIVWDFLSNWIGWDWMGWNG